MKKDIKAIEFSIVRKIRLEDLPAGSLFKFDGCIGFKSEYTTENGAIEAFILESGEMFWGGTSDPKVQRKLFVDEYELN